MPERENGTSLEDFQPVTELGRLVKEEAQRILAEIRTPQDALDFLIRIGAYREDGTPDPRYFPGTDNEEEDDDLCACMGPRTLPWVLAEREEREQEDRQD